MKCSSKSLCGAILLQHNKTQNTTFMRTPWRTYAPGIPFTKHSFQFEKTGKLLYCNANILADPWPKQKIFFLRFWRRTDPHSYQQFHSVYYPRCFLQLWPACLHIAKLFDSQNLYYNSLICTPIITNTGDITFRLFQMMDVTFRLYADKVWKLCPVTLCGRGFSNTKYDMLSTKFVRIFCHILCISIKTVESNTTFCVPWKHQAYFFQQRHRKSSPLYNLQRALRSHGFICFVRLPVSIP